MILYFPVLLHGAFLADDFAILSDIKHGLGGWDHQGTEWYRPLPIDVLSVLWRLVGTNPFPYHLLNIFLLVGTAFAMYQLWLLVVPQDGSGDPVAFVAGLFFLLWPVHSETVCWIADLTDGLSLFLASLSLLTFATYRRAGNRLAAAATPFIIWSAMLSKESAITMPLILVIFSCVAFPGSMERWKARLIEAALLCSLTLAFIMWRAHVIGSLVGGLGAKTHLSLENIGYKAPPNLANVYSPFGKWLALWCGDQLSLYLALLVVLATVAGALWRWPRATNVSTTRWTPSVHFAALMAAPCIWLLVTVNAYCVVLVALAYLFLVYIARPGRTLNDRETVLLRLFAFALICALIPIIPTLNLPVSLAGTNSRRAYFSSFFSSMAFICLGTVYLRGRLASISSSAVLAASAIALWVNNVPWVQTSDVSTATVYTVKSLLPCRRIYILARPDALSEASALGLGMEDVADVTLWDKAVQLCRGDLLLGAVAGDRVTATLIGQDAYRLGVVQNTESRRFYQASIYALHGPHDTDWFKVQGDVVTMIGFNPKTDHVMVIDGTGARVVR